MSKLTGSIHSTKIFTIEFKPIENIITTNILNFPSVHSIEDFINKVNIFAEQYMNNITSFTHKFKIIHNYIPQKYTITLTHISYENDLSCDYSMSYINAFYISYQPIRISAQLRFALYDITKYLTQPCEMNYIDTNIPTFPRINSVDEFNQQIHLFIKRYMQKNTQSHLHIVYNYYPYKYHGHNLDTYYIRFTCLN